METIIDSIIKDWKSENPNLAKLDVGSIQVKYKDDTCGIYTIYFYAGRGMVRIKAIKNPYTNLASLIRRLKTVFGMDIKDTWKIIELK
jgi:hypothetical protein